MIVVDITVVLAGAGFLLRSPVLRTKPTVIFLVVLAGALFGANLLADARAAAVAKSVVVCVYLIGVIRFPHVLARLSKADGDFDERLRAIMKPVRVANAEWLRVAHESQDSGAGQGPARTSDACTVALDSLARLEPPNENWRQTTELLRAYLVAVRDRASSEAHRHPARDLPTDLDIERLIRQSSEAWDVALGKKTRE